MFFLTVKEQILGFKLQDNEHHILLYGVDRLARKQYLS